MSRAARRGRRRPPPRQIRRWRQAIDSCGGFLTVGSVIAALTLVGALITLNRPGSSVSDDPFVPVERVEVSGRVGGNADAPVRIIEYGDFQ